MKKLIIITFLASLSLFSQKPTVFDSLIIEQTNTNWTEFSDYFKSDIIVNKGGVVSEYENDIFYKNGVTGLLISKKDGKVYQSFNLNIDTKNPSNDRAMGNWDLSRVNPNNFFSFDLSLEYESTFNISSNINSITDTIFTYPVDKRHIVFKTDTNANFDFYNIDDKRFIIIYDLLVDDGPVYTPTYQYCLVDIEMNKVTYLNMAYYGYLLGPNNSNFIVRPNNFIFSTTHSHLYYGSYENRDGSDSHDYFNLEGDSLNLIGMYSGAGNFESKLNVILNDSISTIIAKDSIKVFNFRQNSIQKSYYFNIDDKVIGKYHFADKNIVALIIKQADGDKRVFAFHYPSYNIIIDTIDNSPYLGELVANLDDGNFLTIGDENYLYKHKWNLNLTSVVADFGFKLVDDYKVKLTDLSIGAIKNWKWDFGDGNTSNERNPEHQFPAAGKYNVILTVTNEYGVVKQITKELDASKVLKSNFDFTQTQVGSTKKVQFTNLSPDLAIKYIWNFGDGTYSNEKNPEHIYNFPGKYSITLTTFDKAGNYKIYMIDKTVDVLE